MKRVEWDDSLTTGHALVDGQHQELIAIFNEYVDSSLEARDDAVIENLLIRLCDYASTHFAQEEALMHGSGYPADRVAAHIEEHRMLSERTRQLILAHRTGEDSVVSMTALLRDWLAEHIHAVDREFVSNIGSGDPGSSV